MYLDLSTGHDWPVKKVIVQLVYTVDVKLSILVPLSILVFEDGLVKGPVSLL